MPFFKKSQLNEKFIDKTSSETLEMLNFPDCHENVMKVRFVFDLFGYRYFITDNGCCSLEECVLKKNCLIPNHMTALCQLAGAVNWYHEKGMVHGDICPENIFIYEDYFNKCETREKFHLKLGLPYVKNGDGYGDLTKEADCYSVGLLLFFMLTGKHPFQMGKSESEIEMNMRKNRFNLDGLKPIFSDDRINKNIPIIKEIIEGLINFKMKMSEATSKLLKMRDGN